ncbi:ankyrin repeat domain-containing protein 34C [Scleropages formosus]|uniref:ankyrin repeat domain-containing protein 34C n=1 Tax=Scleropages formosus TaxID=113540 RepID=UPI0010FAB7D8|nr:ankyrin repeat domain-containing protein 34C-like [Scleropages formosus]
MGEAQDYLADGSPLIGAAHLGKFRLVRLLVEGGAQINERNQRGETPLLAACKALGGQQGGGPSLRLLQYLLENQADPNSQDKAGRTALMYACMGRAGPEVAAALIAAGADPSLEDYGGASSLVYAINARDQDTLQVLLDACRQKGRDIIIIATELTAGGGSVTRRYLNVPPSPHSSPVACMSPSEIELKTGSPGSDTGGVFDFRGAEKGEEPGPGGDRSRGVRLRSEPFLALQEPEWRDAAAEERRFLSPGRPAHGVGRRWSLHSLGGNEGAETRLRQGKPPPRPPSERPPPSDKPLLLARRNTLPTVQDQPLVQQLSPRAPLACRAPVSGEAPAGTSLAPDPGVRRRVRSPARAGFLPPLPVSPASLAQVGGDRGRRLRSSSVQLERGGEQRSTSHGEGDRGFDTERLPLQTVSKFHNRRVNDSRSAPSLQ